MANTVSQTMLFRQALVKYALKYGVTASAVKYRVNRQYVYRWMKRYDGSLDSLRDRSRRPLHHPNEHTPQELRLINNMYKRNKTTGLVVFWVKLRWRGYRRSISSLYRVLRRIGAVRVKLPNPKLPSAKVYEQMTYPGQKVQIDVKIVPSICLTGSAKGKRFVQYTAIDEYSRMRYLEAFKEQSTLSSALFLKHLTERFKFKIECVQTDNGSEFTNRFIAGRDKPTLFEITAKKLGIVHKLIRPYTPRHNGKVERSHRKDNEYFYATHRFHSFEDFAKQLAVHNRKYNNFPMRPLGWKSPREILFSCSNL